MNSIVAELSKLGDAFPKSDWSEPYTELEANGKQAETVLTAMVEFQFDYEEPDKPENCLPRHCWRLLALAAYPKVIPAMAELVDEEIDNAEIDFPHVIAKVGEDGVAEVSELLEGNGSPFVQTLCVFGLYFSLRSDPKGSPLSKQALRAAMDSFETNPDSVNTALAVVGSRLELSEFSEPLQKIVDSGRFENSGPIWDMFLD